MKTLALLLSASLLPLTNAIAAYQAFPIKNRVAVVEIQDNGLSEIRRYETRRNSTFFRVEVISDLEGTKVESSRNSRPFVAAQRDERFAVRLYNPLPVRVAVNLTVDGLNSISGKPSGISDGDKWMIDPYSSITIRGWQVAQGEARRFFFTDKPKSYAKWMGDRTDKDLSVNCGVIGAAYFWNHRELNRYYEEHPEYRYTYSRQYPMSVAKSRSTGDFAQRKENALSYDSLGTSAAPPAQMQAGTGMGERETNPTTLVDFSYDTGMYQMAQAIVIYYDFAAPTPAPNPFPALSYAPEM